MDNRLKKLTIASIAAISICMPFVIRFECDKSVGYADPVGIPTAGVGHTGPDVIIGKWYDEATRQGWLKNDLTEAAAIVERCAPATIDVYQRAAFVSFAYNVGPGKKGVKDGFCVLKSGKTPTHIRRARAGDKAGSCKALLSWTKAGGKTLPGLVTRRKEEYKLCMMEEKENDGTGKTGIATRKTDTL